MRTAGAAPSVAGAQAAAAASSPTAAQADAFVAEAEKVFAAKSVDASRVAWVNATYITDDTDALAAKSGAEMTDLGVKYALGAAKYANVPGLSVDTKRKLDLLRGGLTLPAPTRPGASDELSMLTTKMSSSYGKGMGTLDGKPINGSDIEAAMGESRDPAKLQEMWDHHRIRQMLATYCHGCDRADGVEDPPLRLLEEEVGVAAVSEEP